MTEPDQAQRRSYQAANNTLQEKPRLYRTRDGSENPTGAAIKPKEGAIYLRFLGITLSVRNGRAEELQRTARPGALIIFKLVNTLGQAIHY
jgi:hypothetical protein